ncbi:MAG: hypothetical protein Q8O99_00385 [bacterium]|nr:hypothetical protein [bacterium]
MFIPRQEEQRSFFDLLLKSHLLDSLSIYTLELFPGSKRYNQQKKELKIKDRLISPLTNKEGKFESTQTSNYNDSIAEEFHRLSAKAQQYGYQRYEISNFALPGKRSIHNMIYRTMQSYL